MTNSGLDSVPSKKKSTPAAKPKATIEKTAITGHPPTSSMVTSAIESLNESEGSSLQAIKKYVADTYKIDAQKITPFIKKYLTTSVDNGTLIRTKGKGVAGSFRLPASTSSEQQPPKKVAPKKAEARSPKKTSSKPKKKVSKPPTKVSKPKTATKKSPAAAAAAAAAKKPKASAKSSTAKKKAAKSSKPKKSVAKKVASKK